MTTNCIVPPKDSYKDRLYTTGAAGYPGCTGKRTYKGDSSDNLFKCPFFASDDRMCSKNTVDFDGSRDGKYPEYASDCAAEMRKNNTSAGSDPDGVGWRRGKG